MAARRHPVRNAGGRQCHVKAFEAIASGGTPSCHASTLRWLEDHGLIERHSIVVGRDALGPIVRPDFSVPTWAHVEWCGWCGENV